MRRLTTKTGLAIGAIAVVAIVAIVVVATRGGGTSWPEQVEVSSSSDYPAPLAGAVVRSRQWGSNGLGISLLRRDGRFYAQLSAVDAQGDGLAGLDVGFGAGTHTVDCGAGCYGAVFSSIPKSVNVAVRDRGSMTTWRVAVPPVAEPDASELVLRAARVWRSLRSLSFHEQLASTAKAPLVSDWRVEAPDRVTYAIAGGSSAIIVGPHRWDKATASSPWVESPQTPVTQPFPAWQLVSDAHVVAAGPGYKLVTFFDPSIPAWFEIRVEDATTRTLDTWMIAPSHFMHDAFAGFDATAPVVPPK